MMMKRNVRSIFKELSLVEIFMICYLLITGIFIALFRTRLVLFHHHIIIRTVVILIILISSQIKRKGFHYIRFILPFVLLAYFYKETDYLNNLIIKQNLDPVLQNWEFLLFNSQPSEIFANSLHNDLIAEIMYGAYFGYYLMIIAIPLYVFIYKDKHAGEESMFLIIGSFIIYYSVFIVFPSAGPQFYPEFQKIPLPDGYLFGKIMRMIQTHGEAPTAAFPSSHIGISYLLVWLCFTNKTRLFYICIPLTLLLTFSAVYIRAHYVVDVIAGIISVPFLHYLLKRIYKLPHKGYISG